MQRSMRPPPPPMDMGGEVFDTPVRPQRRATAGDYGQAYRDIETGYDEPQQSSSRGIWLLAGLLCLALGVAAGGAYFWNKIVKPSTEITAVEQPSTPVVEPPAESPRTEAPQTPDAQAGASTKKRIYDRIVGDREVLGNNLVPTEEAPQQPEQGTQGEVPAAQGEATQEGQPLPMPPPPGENGTIGDQGALPTPAQPSLETSEKSDPAAGESQAAVVPSATPAPEPQSEPQSGQGALATSNLQDQSTTPEPASANNELSQTEAQAPAGLTEQPGTSQSAETVEDNVAPAPAPVRKRITPNKPKQKVAASQSQRSLGSKPVVLVRAKAAPIPRAERNTPAPQRRVARNNGGGVYQEEFVGNSDGGGIYGAELGNTGSSASASQVPSTPPKKKTILGSFQNSEDDVAAVQTPAPTQARRPLFEQEKPRVVEQPVQRASTQSSGTGYVAQIASYVTQADANRAFSALKVKYPNLVSQYRPVISQATVAGSTRYRLALGPLSSQSAANDVCAKLIAAGERDCLAKRQ
jgi:hypothetical protein